MSFLLPLPGFQQEGPGAEPLRREQNQSRIHGHPFLGCWLCRECGAHLSLAPSMELSHTRLLNWPCSSGLPQSEPTSPITPRRLKCSDSSIVCPQPYNSSTVFYCHIDTNLTRMSPPSRCSFFMQAADGEAQKLMALISQERGRCLWGLRGLTDSGRESRPSLGQRGD